MSRSLLFPLPEGLEITAISDTPEAVVVRVMGFHFPPTTAIVVSTPHFDRVAWLSCCMPHVFLLRGGSCLALFRHGCC